MKLNTKNPTKIHYLASVLLFLILLTYKIDKNQYSESKIIIKQ